MTKSIKIQVTDSGLKYFTIYEVRVKDFEGNVHTYERTLNKKEAEKDVDFVYKVHKDLYESAWVIDQMVWC